MERNSKSDLEFSLVDVILPLVEMWKLLLATPIAVAGLVYIFLQIYPDNLTYGSVVHLPVSKVETLVTERSLTKALSALDTNYDNVLTARELRAKLEVLATKEDETRLTILLPRGVPATEAMDAVSSMLKPEAENFLKEQRQQNAADIVISGQTIATLQASAVELNTALATAQSASPPDITKVNGLTRTLVDVTNALWTAQSYLTAMRVRFGDLQSATAVQPFTPELRTTRYVALSFGGTLFLVLLFIYIRQEFLFALSHDSGKQKVTRLMQSLRITGGRKSTRP